MKALHDPDGRRRLARIVVWGSPPRMLSREAIMHRLEKVLERMAAKLDGKKSDK